MNKIRPIGVEGISFKRCNVLLSQLINPDGSYNWDTIDRPISSGLPIVLRVVCNDPNSRQHFHGESMPVIGVPTTMAHLVRPYNHEGKGLCYEYDYDDPLFSLVLNNFIADIGTRFDGHPNLLAVEVGIFGQWGEWTTYANGKSLMFGKKLQRRVISQYLAFFKKTPVLGRIYRQLPHDKTQVSVAWEFASREKPLGLHVDSFGHPKTYCEFEQLNEFPGIQDRTLVGAELLPEMTVECLTDRFNEICEKVRQYRISYVKLNRMLVEGNKKAQDNLYELDMVVRCETGYRSETESVK